MIQTLKYNASEGIIVSFPQKEKERKLRKDGTPKQVVQNKKKGVKSEVYSFEPADIKKIADYFVTNEKWQHYLIFILGCNMARRIGDILSLTWAHFFDPKTGKIRKDLLEIQEEKTDKIATPHINSTCRDAIMLYIEKTGCNPVANNYSQPVFLQTEGGYKGRVISADAYRKAVKKAAADVGITYNVGTHSSRKTFGAVSKMLHAGDHDSMELLQTIYNHSDAKTTNRYIGLTKKKIDQYYDDIGEFFDEYVVGEGEMQPIADKPVLSIASADLMDVIKIAYEAGQKNADAADAMTHINSIMEIMDMVEQLIK